MAEVGGCVSGEDWYGANDHRLDRLAERVLSGWRDAGWFAEKTGIAQEKLGEHTDLGWVELYRKHALHPADFEDLHKAGPYAEPRLGGSLTLMGDRSPSSGG
jgi:poly(beta-D-mannuronate) lyase